MIAVGLLLLSGVAGYSRGGVKEMVGFVSITLAMLVAAYSMPFTAPFVRVFIHPAWAGAAAAIVAVFVVAYLVIRWAGNWLSENLAKSTTLGEFDRLIGLTFGIVRGLVFMGLFSLIFNAITPKALMPEWISGAVLYPVAQGAGTVLGALAPKGMAMSNGLSKDIQTRVKQGFSDPARNQTDAGAAATGANDPDPSQGNPPIAGERKALHTVRRSSHPGYSPSERRDVDALVEHSR